MILYVFDKESLSWIQLEQCLDQILKSMQQRMWLAITHQMFRAFEINQRQTNLVSLPHSFYFEGQTPVNSGIHQYAKAP